jgi:hypothetical protein
MTYEQAKRQARLEAVMCGGIAQIDGKDLTGVGGYWYLDGEKVTDIEGMLKKVEVDENYVKSLMK